MSSGQQSACQLTGLPIFPFFFTCINRGMAGPGPCYIPVLVESRGELPCEKNCL